MGRRRDRLAPVILFILLAVLAVSLWRNRAVQRRALFESYAGTVADQAAIRLEAWFAARMAGLAVMTGEISHELATTPPLTRSDFLYLARAFQRAQPGFQAINLIDSTGVVRVVEPEGANRGVLGFDLLRHPEPSVRVEVARAIADTTVTVTGAVGLLQGGQGFASYWPLVVNGELRGLVNGVFRIDESVRAALASGVLGDFRVELREGDHLIFASDSTATVNGVWGVNRTIGIAHGPPWRLTLIPRTAVVARYNPPGTYVALVFNLAFALLLALLAHAFVRRSEVARAARDEALRELTQRRRLEAEQARTIVQLERANHDLAATNRELDAYIYAASHDVRAPLVAVAGLVDILLEPNGSSDPEERQHIIGRVRHNIRRLDTLVQDMLIVSRSRRLERTSEPIDIAAVCTEVWGTVKDLGGDGPMEFTLGVTPGRPFRTDPLRFRQIINNLLSNAVKYRDPAKPLLRVAVNARLGDLPGDGTRLTLTVRDNGVGVPDVCLGRIFDMFYKASNDAFGSGLGLYIVRQHCAALGGEVVCTPLPDGTEFRIELPGDAP
ncbi:MAG: sensor histidine kinase [Candidatus Krumholzibacteriia bacterium]